MLRTAVLIFGFLVLALGAYLCTKGVASGGVQTLIGGGIIVLGTLFERWRYHNAEPNLQGSREPARVQELGDVVADKVALIPGLSAPQNTAAR
jgi:hypothetical protein